MKEKSKVEFYERIRRDRRLKRYITREVHPVIIDALSTPPEELLQAA